MGLNLRYASGPNGARNVFDNILSFATYGGSPGASGSANLAAVSSFNTAYAALTGKTKLIIPPGTYSFSGGFVFGASGGKDLTIDAYGATLSSPPGTSNGFANSGPFNDWTHHANFDTVSAGGDTITLADTSLFTVGKWVLLTAVDRQGYGYPPNPDVFEFKKVASKGAGSLTFTEPLLYAYKSTYPNYNPGNPEIYQGGPATVYVLRDAWDQEIELQGATLTDTGNLFYGKCRVAKYTDCLFNTYGPTPTVNLLYRMLRCNCPGFGGLEIDKIVQRAEFIDSTPRAVDFQSAAVNDLYVNNVTSSSRWRGGGKSNYFKSLSTPDFEFGLMNYGAMGPTYMEDCVSSGATWFSSNVFPFSDYTEEGGGVLSYAGGPAPASRDGYWAVPGISCVLLDGSNGFARSFQVLDLTASGGRTYVTTNLPYPLPSTINGKSAPWRIAAHPCADLTMVNGSGGSLFTSQSALPAHSPLFGWTL